MAKEAMLYDKLDNQEVHCFLCNHHCRIKPGKFGICGMRENREGKLYTHAYGDVIAYHVDPIEKKPLYHFLPGSRSYSIATIGCNFKCGFCQNWQISQISVNKKTGVRGRAMSPEKVVEEALANNCQSISYTYTEPTIFFEFAYDTARIAKDKGIKNCFVTNGFMTKDALDTIRPYLDACNVDLKAFTVDFYKETCKGRLQPVLDSIRYIKKLNIWLEVTTLVVPGSNDSEQELAQIAQFIAGVDPEIPWHISRFHPDYQFDGAEATPISTMEKAHEQGKKAGLKYIYLGNIPGESDTLCPQCGRTVIFRRGFSVGNQNMENSKCSSCGTRIAGVF